MFWGFVKGLILTALIVFYAVNLYNNSHDLYGAVLFNRLNFAVLVAILFLAGDYIKICTTLCILTIIGGLMFHGYIYYKIYSADKDNANAGQVQTKCRGAGGSWYTKLNSNCY